MWHHLVYVAETLPINLSHKDGDRERKLDFVKRVVKYLILNICHILKAASPLQGATRWLLSPPPPSLPLAGVFKWLCGVRFNEGDPWGQVGVFSANKLCICIYQEIGKE